MVLSCRIPWFNILLLPPWIKKGSLLNFDVLLPPRIADSSLLGLDVLLPPKIVDDNLLVLMCRCLLG